MFLHYQVMKKPKSGSLLKAAFWFCWDIYQKYYLQTIYNNSHLGQGTVKKFPCILPRLTFIEFLL